MAVEAHAQGVGAVGEGQARAQAVLAQALAGDDVARGQPAERELGERGRALAHDDRRRLDALRRLRLDHVAHGRDRADVARRIDRDGLDGARRGDRELAAQRAVGRRRVAAVGRVVDLGGRVVAAQAERLAAVVGARPGRGGRRAGRGRVLGH